MTELERLQRRYLDLYSAVWELPDEERDEKVVSETDHADAVAEAHRVNSRLAHVLDGQRYEHESVERPTCPGYWWWEPEGMRPEPVFWDGKSEWFAAEGDLEIEFGADPGRFTGPILPPDVKT